MYNKNLTICFLLILSALSVFSYVSDSSRVLELTDRFLEARREGQWLVMFYAPWCGYCKRTEPIFALVAQALHATNVRVGRLDCTKYTAVARELKIKGYPTIMFLKGDMDNFLDCLKYEFKEYLELYWKFPMNSPIFAAPVVFKRDTTSDVLDVDGFDVIICSTKGQIVIVSLKSATWQGSFELSGEIFSTPYYYKNNFYVGCRDNFLYAFSIKQD